MLTLILIIISTLMLTNSIVIIDTDIYFPATGKYDWSKHGSVESLFEFNVFCQNHAYSNHVFTSSDIRTRRASTLCYSVM